MLTSPLTAFERRFYYMTAHNHYNAGCPDLSLQVLLDLPLPEDDGSSVSIRAEVVFNTHRFGVVVFNTVAAVVCV